MNEDLDLDWNQNWNSFHPIHFSGILMHKECPLLSTHVPLLKHQNTCFKTSTKGRTSNMAPFMLSLCSGLWTDLPKLNPLRAQHGCALVELNGEKGVVVVGGDSGGTRLSDVR